MIAKNLSIAPLSILTGIILIIGCSDITAKSIPNTPTESVVTATKSETKPQKRSGSFISGEHTTTGVANIVQENGTYYIELDQTFKTSSSGPDLFVILHRSPDILKITKPPDYGIAEGDFVAIAPLKGFDGKQRYEIPKNIQPDNYIRS